MSQSPRQHDHSELAELLAWLQHDDENVNKQTDVDGTCCTPHYWASNRRPGRSLDRFSQWGDRCVDARDMESRLQDICRSLSCHYFDSKLSDCVSVFRERSLAVKDGKPLDGEAVAHEDDGEVVISVDFEKHGSNKELIETLLHEMAHAWIMEHADGEVYGEAECEKDECRPRHGANGHGEDWLVLTKALKLGAERLHGEEFCLGRGAAVVDEMEE